MSDHRGGTDALHKVTLPSAIQLASWSAVESEVGSEAPLEVWTLFVGDGQEVKAEVRNKDGKTLGKVSGKVASGRWAGSFPFPDKSEGEAYFEAEIPKCGLKARSNLLKVWPRRELTNAKWDKTEARRGDVVKLTADAQKFADWTEVKLSIYEHDADGGHDFITELTADVQKEKIEVEWEYDYHDDTREIPTQKDLNPVAGSYRHLEYFFVAWAAGKEAKSGLLKFQDWLEIQPKDVQGRPVPNRDFVVTLADGSERRGTLDANGRARIEDVPPGPIRISFPKKK